MIGPFVHDALAGRVVFGARDGDLAASLCKPFAQRVGGASARFARTCRSRSRSAPASRRGGSEWTACCVCIGGGSATGMANAAALVRAVPAVAVRDRLADAAAALRALAAELGAPVALGEIGFDPRSLGEAVELVLEQLPAQSPCSADRDAVRRILEDRAAPVS